MVGQPLAAFGKLEMLPGCHQGSLGTYAPSNDVSVPVFVYVCRMVLDAYNCIATLIIRGPQRTQR
jgi:hypothetical protein